MTQGGEEAAEMIATIRGEHVVMKKWFMGESAQARALRKKWGNYPGLWKEVLNWKGWKEARREYLAFQQTDGMGRNNNEEGDKSFVPRKRKSRWGTADNKKTNEGPTRRRSRWSSAPAPSPAPTVSTPINRPLLPGLPGMPSNLNPRQRQEMEHLQSRLREVNVRLQNVDIEAARVDALPVRERSPSPPPVYGPDGKRKNTRAVRWRERLSTERHDLLEKLMNFNGTRHNPLFRRKRTKKIPIPVDEHPNYNFIGLIIGPRGKTQKELEAKTGCKIAIRGKGSVKEGARGRRDGKVMDGDFEPLHVVITGEDQKSVDAATDMIQQMLIVIDDEKNVHKQAQLRELALLNGTLKEEEFCQICAEKGHRAFECPKRFAGNKSRIQVKCAICGDTSHPTRDCTQNRAQLLGQQESKKNAQEMDSDYANFMAELDGKKVEPSTAKKETSIVAPGGESSGVTILKPIAATAAPTTNTSLPPPPVSVGAVNLPPSSTTNLPLPPAPAHLPPPQGLVPPNPNLLPPPPPPPPVMQPPSIAGVTNGPPPPPQLPPQIPTNYSAYNQQTTYSNNYNYNQQQWQQPQQPQHHQQQQYNNTNDETAGWDYKSFYGGQANSGAGGFNWWEN